MIKIEVFDNDDGYIEEETLDSHEVLALALNGWSMPEIASVSILKINDKSFDVGEWQNKFPLAKAMLDNFWKRNSEEALTELIRSTDSIYFLECTTSVSKMFRDAGAVAVPCSMVKHLIHEDVVPYPNSDCYMHQGQELPNQGAWKTLFLLPSLEIYDKVQLQILDCSDMTFHSVKEAVSTVAYLYSLIAEESVYDFFPRHREIVRRAQNYLDDHHDEMTQYDAEIRFRYSKYFLQDYHTIELRDIPEKYIETVVDDEGGVYSKSGKRLVKIADKKNFTATTYKVKEGCESLDDGAMCCIDSLEQVLLPNSLHRIGANQFLNDKNLKLLTIPSSVDFDIEGSMCEHCTSLESVVFNNHQEYLDIAMFNGCSSLKDVQLPQTLVGLSDNVFAGTKSLKTLDIPTVRWIGGECFRDSAIERIVLPKCIKSVASDAFVGVPSECININAFPTYFNYPLSFDAEIHLLPRLFVDGWILDLMRMYAYIRYIQDHSTRVYLLEDEKRKLKEYLNWIRNNWWMSLSNDDIESFFATMKISGFSPLYFLCVLNNHLAEQDLRIVNRSSIVYACEFKANLRNIYDLIGESGTYNDIEKWVNSIGTESVKHLDPMMKSEIDIALSSTFSHNGKTIVRMRRVWGYSPEVGNTITVDTKSIIEVADTLNQMEINGK